MTARRTFITLLCALLMTVGSASYHAQGVRPASNVTVIEGMTLIDGVADRPIEDAVIVIENDKIKSVGKRGSVVIPAGARRVNAAGKTVMPAINALHAHIGRNKGAEFMVSHGVSIPQTREGIQNAANAYLYYGVTHIISLGYDQQPMAEFIADQRAGKAGGAVVYSAGEGYAVKEYRPEEGLHRPTTPAEAREAVREEAAKHLGPVSFTKFWVDDSRGLPKLTPEVYGAIIDESHKHHKKAVVHTFSVEDGKELMRRGIDAITHSLQQPVDDEYIRLAKQHGTLMIFDILRANTSTAYFDDPGLPGLFPSDVIEAARRQTTNPERAANPNAARTRETNQLSLQQDVKMAAAGIPFAIGSDSGEWQNFSGQSEHREMETLVKGGIPAMQVIKAATLEGARFLGLEKTHGTLVPGKAADFLILNGNPLSDILNSRKIDAVWVNGKPIDRAALTLNHRATN